MRFSTSTWRTHFELRDVDRTLTTMTDSPYVNHVPVMTGGAGRDEVRTFHTNHFIGKWPEDTKITRVSRTVGKTQIVEEMVMTFTHDIVMDAILPGRAPTGRRVGLPVVVVMACKEGKVAHEHIYWDQATALVQTGVLDPKGLPVVGVEQARKLLDTASIPSNELIATPAPQLG